MKILFKASLILLSFIGLIKHAYAQHFYYSAKKQNFLTEDTTTIVFKIMDQKNTQTLLSSIASNLFTNFDTTKSNGFIVAKLKPGVIKKDALKMIRNSKKVLYSWHSIKSLNTVIIPTGEILLQPKKDNILESILLKTNTKNKVHVKGIDRYGVITLEVLNDDNLFPVANQIYESGLVEWCHPDFWTPIERTTNDPLFSSQYYLKNTGQTGGTYGIDINVVNAWNLTKGNSSIKIAVIDDGVEDHEDLSGRVLSGYTPRSSSISTGMGKPLPTTTNWNGSYVGHGEACAGIIAASQDNFIGISGIAPECQIVPVNIFYDGNESTSDLANAINWAWDNGQADVISNSWVYNISSQTNYGFDNIIQAIENARTYGRNGKGSLVVFSSGNDYHDRSVKFPANVDGVISVGAIDKYGNLWSYSCYGSEMDLVAPSGNVNFSGDFTTTDRMGSLGYETGNYTPRFGGTSAACPQVSGVAALILSVNPNLTEVQAKSILQSTASDMGSQGFDVFFGFGRLNACAAVYKAYGTTFNITGDEYMCHSSGTYSISNLPAGAIVNWQASPGGIVTINSPNSSQASITKVTDGIIILTANITNVSSCNPEPVIITKQIRVGSPYIQTFINGANEVYANAGYYYTLLTTPWDLNISNINWRVPPGWTIMNGQGSTTITAWTGTTGGAVEVDFDDPCGINWGYFKTVIINGNGGIQPLRVIVPKGYSKMDSGLTIFPNPANDIITVSLSAINTKTNSTCIKQIKISNKTGLVQKNIIFGDNAKSRQINIGFLLPDIYTVQVYDNKIWRSIKVVKK